MYVLCMYAGNTQYSVSAAFIQSIKSTGALARTFSRFLNHTILSLPSSLSLSFSFYQYDDHLYPFDILTFLPVNRLVMLQNEYILHQLILAIHPRKSYMRNSTLLWKGTLFKNNSLCVCLWLQFPLSFIHSTLQPKFYKRKSTTIVVAIITIIVKGPEYITKCFLLHLRLHGRKTNRGTHLFSSCNAIITELPKSEEKFSFYIFSKTFILFCISLNYICIYSYRYVNKRIEAQTPDLPANFSVVII